MLRRYGLRNNVFPSKERLLRTLLKKLVTANNNPWSAFPFGKKPKAPAETYLRLFNDAKGKRYLDIEKYEEKMGHAAPTKWLEELALQTQIVIKRSPLCYAHGRVLYSALANYLSGCGEDSVVVVDIGTARGFSALCMAKALEDQNTPGTLITFDVLPHKEPMYWNCIADANGPQTRTELLRPWAELIEKYIIFYQGDVDIFLPAFGMGRVNFAFIDGGHGYSNVIFEGEHISQSQKTGDMIVFDDYSVDKYPGIVKAVTELCQRCGYDGISVKAEGARAYFVATKR